LGVHDAATLSLLEAPGKGAAVTRLWACIAFACVGDTGNLIGPGDSLPHACWPQEAKRGIVCHSHPAVLEEITPGLLEAL
jgi:hypothetical protein